MSTKLSNILVLCSIILASIFSNSLAYDLTSNKFNSQDSFEEVKLKDKVNIVKNKINLRLSEKNSSQTIKNPKNEEIAYLEDNYNKESKLKIENKNFFPIINNSIFDSVTVVDDFKNNNLYSISDNDSFTNGENTRIVYGIKIKPNKKHTPDILERFNENQQEKNYSNINAVKLNSSAKFAGFLSFD